MWGPDWDSAPHHPSFDPPRSVSVSSTSAPPTTVGLLVIDNYILKERRSLADMQRRLDKHLSSHFGVFLMSEITSDVIYAFVAARKKASNGEINRELAIVKRAFTLAARARKVHARPHIEMLPEAQPRPGSSSMPISSASAGTSRRRSRRSHASVTRPAGAGNRKCGPSNGAR